MSTNVFKTFATYSKHLYFNTHFHIDTGPTTVKQTPTIAKDLHATSGFMDGPITWKPRRMRLGCHKYIFFTQLKIDTRLAFIIDLLPFDKITFGDLKIWRLLFRADRRFD